MTTELSLLPGCNVLIEGATGTGKTTSIGSLVDAGVRVSFLGLESGIEALFGYWADKGKEVPPNVSWHKFGMQTGGFTNLSKAAEQIGSMTQDSLYKVQDFERGKKNEFLRLLGALTNFPDDRTGQKLGPIDQWGPDSALVIDGLTGVGIAAMSMVIGNKPLKSQTDWGIAQDQVEKLLRQLCDGCACHFVLLSHIEREVDEVQGGTKVTVSTLGKKLAPKIPAMFSDVILAQRAGTKFTWSTANSQTDLKARNLPIADDIPQDFGAILAKWKSRGGRFTCAVKK